MTVTVIMAGPLTVDTGTREARAHRGLLLLTAGEFDLLRVLAGDPDRLWTVPELLALVPQAPARGERWLDLRAAHLASQLARVGVRNDILNHRGFHGGEREYRLFEPARDRATA